MSTADLMREAAEKLCKWRGVYTGWRLGTRPKEDGESQYTRDLHEMILLLRAEVSALTFVVVELGLPEERLHELMLREYAELDHLQELKFPGFSTSLAGVHMRLPEAHQTMQRKGFPA